MSGDSQYGYCEVFGVGAACFYFWFYRCGSFVHLQWSLGSSSLGLFLVSYVSFGVHSLSLNEAPVGNVKLSAIFTGE